MLPHAQVCRLQKEHVSQSSMIELTQLDRGESYCFSVQAYIPSRAYGKQLGEESHLKCSQENGSILKGEGGALLFWPYW